MYFNHFCNFFAVNSVSINFICYFQFVTASDYASGVKSGISFVVDMIWLFCCCHYGFQITERFDNINDTVYQLEWYTYPTKIQKDLQLIIASSQRSIYIEGFCNTRCTRDKFTKVRNLNNKAMHFLLRFPFF